jgi:UDP-glucuronate 4-epimerase
VIGLDNLNDYYDVELKKARLAILEEDSNFQFVFAHVEDRLAIDRLFAENKIHIVIHLAAQAGVRYSLQNPHSYIQSNIVGFLNILEGCRHHDVEHLVYASSSSVYGANEKMPFSTSDNVDHPVSLYAATKKSNELMAHTYSHLYNLPTTGLRFFTVYGPWGRPDMALFLFTKAILNNEPIKVFNNGQMQRDFTYVDDIIEGLVRVIQSPPKENQDFDRAAPDPGSSYAPYKIYNIGNNKPVQLMELIQVLEQCLGMEAKKEFLPMQPGDVASTYANVDSLITEMGFQPKTSIDVGVKKFVEWYREHYSNRFMR